MGELSVSWGMDGLFEQSTPTPASAPSEPLLHDLSSGKTAFIPVATPPEDFDDEPQSRALAPLSEWPAQLPMAIALQVEELPAILDRFAISPARFELLKPLPAFRKALAEAQRDLAEQGHTFKLKCRGIAEDFLETLYLELHNANVGLSTKVDVFKYLTKMGGLEPVAAPQAQASSAPQVNIQINL